MEVLNPPPGPEVKRDQKRAEKKNPFLPFGGQKNIDARNGNQD